MNPFSYVVLIAIFMIFLKYKNIKKQYLIFVSLLICFDMFINIGYFFKLGSYEIQYTEMFLLVTLLYSMYFILYKGINKKCLIIGSILVASVLVTESMLGINPIKHQFMRNYDLVQAELSLYSIMISLRVVMIVVNVVNWKKIFDDEDFSWMASFIHKFGRVIIIVCIFEFFTKNILSSSIYINLINSIFGVGESTVTFIFQRAGFYTLQGLTREPSLMTRGFFYYIVILLFSKKLIDIKWDILAISVLFIMSGSFAAVLYLTAVFTILLLRLDVKRKVVIVLPAIMFLVFFVRSELGYYYTMRIMRSLSFFSGASTESMRTTSEAFRFTSIIDTFKLLGHRPFFGVGLGIPYSYGYISSALASIGIIGFFMWYYYTFHSISSQSIKTMKYILILLVVWMFTDSMNVMYSGVTFYIAILIGKSKQRNSIRL